jgi:hypothetical protein
MVRGILLQPVNFDTNLNRSQIFCTFYFTTTGISKELMVDRCGLYSWHDSREFSPTSRPKVITPSRYKLVAEDSCPGVKRTGPKAKSSHPYKLRPVKCRVLSPCPLYAIEDSVLGSGGTFFISIFWQRYIYL